MEIYREVYIKEWTIDAISCGFWHEGKDDIYCYFLSFLFYFGCRIEFTYVEGGFHLKYKL